MRTIIVMLVAVGSRSCSAAAQSLQLLLLASGTIMAAFLRFGAFGAAGFQTQGCRTDAKPTFKVPGIVHTIQTPDRALQSRELC